MNTISTHVLDTALGLPAATVSVTLDFLEAGQWKKVGIGVTNKDGRVTDLLSGAPLQKGRYRITFDLGKYFAGQSRKSFYPEASIVFEIENPGQHHHVPLLLSGYGYTTYRGT